MHTFANERQKNPNKNYQASYYEEIITIDFSCSKRTA